MNKKIKCNKFNNKNQGQGDNASNVGGNTSNGGSNNSNVGGNDHANYARKGTN